MTKMAANRGMDADTDSLIVLETMTVQRRAPLRRREGRRAGVSREA